MRHLLPLVAIVALASCKVERHANYRREQFNTPTHVCNAADFAPTGEVVNGAPVLEYRCVAFVRRASEDGSQGT